jgi:uncharacterized membrane protein
LTDVTPSRRDYIILGLIVLAGALVRIVGLTRESLWTDETFSAYATMFATPAEVLDYARSDVHPPGYYLALWWCAKVFGNGEFTLRLFSAIGGVLLLPIVFRIGRQLFTVRTGLVAALFAAFLIQSIYFSQEVRAYSWMATLSALAVTLAIDWRNDGGAFRILLLAITTIVLAYFHYFGLMFSALVWTTLLIIPARWDSKLPVVGGAAAFVLVFLPWLPIAVAQRSRDNWIPAPDMRYIAELFNVYFGPGLPVDAWFAAILACGVALATKRGGVNWKSRENFLLIWIIAPLVVALTFSMLIRPVYSPRNMLIGSGAAIILLARSVEEIGNRLRNLWLPALGVLIGAYAIHFATGKGYLLKPIKQQIREASQYALDRNKNLPVYTVSWDRMNFAYYYNLSGRDHELKVVDLSAVENRGLAAVVPEREFWILSAGIDINQIDNLPREFEVIDSAEYIAAHAYRLRRKQP